MSTGSSTPSGGHRPPRPFDDEVLRSLRARQRDLMDVLADDVREPLMPFVEGEPPALASAALERSLRERVEEIVGGTEELRDFLQRSRRTRFAELRRDIIEARYLELAGDAPAGMDAELAAAVSEIDPAATHPTAEEVMLLARIVPLIAWPDHLASQG
jgi:hypothetical protein